MIQPFSYPIRHEARTVGVVNVNCSLSFLADVLAAFVQPEVVIYVMAPSSQGSILLSSSIGEPLSVNGKLVPATSSTNLMIRASAQYWSTHSVPAGGGAYVTISGTTGSYVTAASLTPASLNSYEPALNWIIVAVTIDSDSSSSGQAAASTTISSYGATEVADAIQEITVGKLTDIIQYGYAIRFLAGNASANLPLRTPIVHPYMKSKTSSSQQVLWGMSNAYKFTNVSGRTYSK